MEKVSITDAIVRNISTKGFFEQKVLYSALLNRCLKGYIIWTGSKFIKDEEDIKAEQWGDILQIVTKLLLK